MIRQAPKTVIYATGMIYEKKKQTVTLLNRVRAHYEKPVMPNQVKQTTKSKQKKTQQKRDKQAKAHATTSNTKNTRIRRSYE